MILVDELKSYPDQMIHASARLHGVRWCHMVSDTSLEELHAFARKIGLQRRWFQGDHYDLTGGRRAVAVRLGAQEVSTKELVKRRVKE